MRGHGVVIGIAAGERLEESRAAWPSANPSRRTCRRSGSRRCEPVFVAAVKRFAVHGLRALGNQNILAAAGHADAGIGEMPEQQPERRGSIITLASLKTMISARSRRRDGSARRFCRCDRAVRSGGAGDRIDRTISLVRSFEPSLPTITLNLSAG